MIVFAHKLLMCVTLVLDLGFADPVLSGPRGLDYVLNLNLG
jgi:hypothetical protein